MSNIERKATLNPYSRHEIVDYAWQEGEFAKLDAVSTGTPCLRYLVRQPDGHRDVDDLDQGLYSFGAFGFRKDIGGEIKQQRRDKDSFGKYPLIAYCPDFNDPFGMDFFGVTSPGLYNFEILDRFQQKLTLVGVAHLHLHKSGMEGATIVSFNADGSMRYIEEKTGERRNHDSVLYFDDRIEFKVGSQLTGIKRKDREVFGVPKWAFSEDMSAKVTIQFTEEDVEPKIAIARNLPDENELRFGHPEDPGQFSNRQIGTEVVITANRHTNWERNLDFVVDSSSHGKSRLRVLVRDGIAVLEIVDIENQDSKTILSADTALHQRLSKDLQTLPLGDLPSLDINTVSDYSEYLFRHFHQLLLNK